MPLARGYRYFQRYRQIANTLAAQGLGFLVDSLGLREHLSLPFQRKANEHIVPRGVRLRQALQDLGPTFVKLGQMFSTRTDLLPADIVKELAKLQDDVPPFPFEQARQQIETELGQNILDIFREFAEKPLAAASIGQVHRAVLFSGEEVVVKVQRPGVFQVIETDLQILFDLARVASRHTSLGKLYDFVEIVEEFDRTLKGELDYSAEGRNADRFRSNFANEEKVYIPRVLWQYSSPRVLTLEYVHGTKLFDASQRLEQGYDKKDLATTFSSAMLKQILVDGFFHADPHPGNLSVIPGNVLVFMDFGMVGNLSESRKDEFISLIIGLARRNSKEIVRAVLDMGIVSDIADLKSLRRDVDRLRDRYYDISFSEINLGEAVMEILKLAFKYKIRLPSEFTLLAKCLLTAEGVTQQLDPDFSIVEIAEPYGLYLMKQRMDPRRVMKQIGENIWEIGSLVRDVPQTMVSLLDKLERDQVKIKLEHENLRGLTSHLDRVVNRISFSIVLLAFSIVVSGLVIGSALGADSGSQFFWNLPILEIGFLVASIMFLGLLLSIFRTGRF